jgi:autotransporter-associated beta strand protein
MDFTGSFSTNDTSTTRTVTNDLTSGHTLTMASGTGSKFNITGPVIITSAVADSRMVIPGEVFGTKAFGKTGTGTVVFTGTNTFSGVHTVAGGTLQFGKAASLVAASWTAAKVNVKSGATLALNVGGTGEFTDTNVDTLLAAISVANTAIEGLQSGAILGFDTSTASGGTFTQGNTIANSTGSGSFHGAIGVTKLGGGTLVLDKTNTYTGATTVSAGKLVVSGNISTSTLTTVAVGATLGGTGTVGKAIINGTLVVGNSPGQMNFTDTLGLNGTTVMEIDGTAGAGVTGGHDFINLTGAGAAGVLTYGGAMTLDIGAIFGAGTYSWNLFDMASETGTYTTITLADQYSGTLLDGDLNGVWDLTSGSNTWQFTESTGVLGLTVVPEPSVAALLGGVGTLILLRRRRA